MSFIQIEDIVVKYGALMALKGITIDIERGELLSLLGPSGCGKTTTIRIIAGFVHPSQGNVYINGERVNEVPSYKRNIGVVFQNFALFPHMTCAENISFGLRRMKLKKNIVESRLKEIIALLHLDGLEKRYPGELSGGQQQRMALARAMVISPDVLLLDEPLGSLDKKLREEMQIELRQLQKKVGITTILVTHDQEEAITLSDRVAVMNDGVIEQIGTPTEIYEKPRSKFVADFIGINNFINGNVVKIGNNEIICKIGEEETVLAPFKKGYVIGQAVDVIVRPESIELSEGIPLNMGNFLKGIITNIIYKGANISFFIRLSNNQVIVASPNKLDKSVINTNYSKGSEVFVSWKLESSYII